MGSLTMNNDQNSTILTEYVDFLEDNLSIKLLDDIKSPVVDNEAAMISALRRYCLQKNVDANAD